MLVLMMKKSKFDVMNGSQILKCEELFSFAGIKATLWILEKLTDRCPLVMVVNVDGTEVIQHISAVWYRKSGLTDRSFIAMESNRHPGITLGDFRKCAHEIHPGYMCDLLLYPRDISGEYGCLGIKINNGWTANNGQEISIISFIVKAS